MTQIDLSRLPQHVAIIMDGNGRWAQQKGWNRALGHEAGSEAVRRTVRACRKLGIRALTLYAFSEQNWSRPKAEVEALMLLLCQFLRSEREEMIQRRIRLRAVGRLERLSPTVRAVLDEMVEQTRDHDGMVLTLALSYGGQEEIVDAARALAKKVASGELDPEAIDVELLGASLPSMEVGPVDLMIRTSGEERISNFLLWGAAYAELYFTTKLWPEYGEADLFAAVAAYQERDRRFGRVLLQSALGAAQEAPPVSRAHA